jgi:hypothetical protein
LIEAINAFKQKGIVYVLMFETKFKNNGEKKAHPNKQFQVKAKKLL